MNFFKEESRLKKWVLDLLVYEQILPETLEEAADDGIHRNVQESTEDHTYDSYFMLVKIEINLFFKT